MSRFYVEIFLSHSTGKFCRGTLQSFINFGHRKNLRFKGLCHDFLSKIFCFTVPEKFVGEPFSLSLISGIGKISLQRVMSRFSVENFLSHSTGKFCRGTL